MKKENSFDDPYSDSKDMFGHPYQELQNFFKNHPKGSVLDLGCGQGRDSLFLAKIGYQVTAVDISDVGISQLAVKAQEQGLELNSIASNILDLTIDKKFDVILFDMILHFFEKEQQIIALKKYADLLNQNGKIIIVYPDDMKAGHFMDILKSLDDWELKNKIVAKDVPKLNEEQEIFTFEMIVIQKK